MQGASINISWLKDHVWLCTYIMLGIAALTFLLNFVFKKHKIEKGQTIKKIKNSTINQAGGDINTKSNE